MKKFVGFQIDEEAYIDLGLSALINRASRSEVIRDVLTEFIFQTDRNKMMDVLAERFYHTWKAEWDGKKAGKDNHLILFEDWVKHESKLSTLPDNVLEKIMDKIYERIKQADKGQS